MIVGEDPVDPMIYRNNYEKDDNDDNIDSWFRKTNRSLII
jgi:hypothetical protein